MKMTLGHKQPNWSLYSAGLIVLFTVLQVIRWNTLPQFVDDFYHLLVAENFIKAGGWVGWDFFEYAPLGRPHLYPPVYHTVLAFFLERGADSLGLIKSLEVLIVPLFLIVLFLVCRELFSSVFSFCMVLLCGSSFHFFVSLASNIPASIALIWGLLFWLGIQRRDTLLAIASMSLCFYTHAGISALFFIAGVATAVLDRSVRRLLIIVLAASLAAASPLLIHYWKYASFVRSDILSEQRFGHISIGVLLVGIGGMFIAVSAKKQYYFILGVLLGSQIVFYKYFYRYFAAQGFVGWALSACAFLEYLGNRAFGSDPRGSPSRNVRMYQLFFIGLLTLFFLSNPTFTVDNQRSYWGYVDTTFSKYVQGRVFEDVSFQSILSKRYFSGVLQALREHTRPEDIIHAHPPEVRIASVMAAAFTGRLSADALFYEIKPFRKTDPFAVSQAIIWVRSPQDDPREEKYRHDAVTSLNLEKLYENDVFMVFRNPQAMRFQTAIPTSHFPLSYMYILLALFLGLILFRITLRPVRPAIS